MDDRIFQDSDELWYYRARGGQKAGPFESRAQAELALAKQLRSWGADPKPKAVLQNWRPKKLLQGNLMRRTRRRSGS